MSRLAQSAVLVVVLAAGGCGGATPKASLPPAPGSTPSSTAPTAPVGQRTDPCTLLTVAQVSAAVGATVGPGRETALPPPLGGHSCLWATASVPVRTFQVTLRTAVDITAAGQTPALLYAESVSLAGTSQSLVAVAGVGDRAEIGRSRAFVLKGGTYMTTDVGFGTSATAHAALVTLTTAAAARV